MDDQICTCIALNHDHPSKGCARKATIKGGICDECRHYEC